MNDPKVEFVKAEWLSVASDEVLIIRLGEETPNEFAEQLAAELERLGLSFRSMILWGDGIEFTTAKREGARP